MIDTDLLKRVNDRRAERGMAALELNELETVQIEARRSLCEEMGNFFAKDYTIALVGGVGTLYNLTGPVNPDLLWTEFGRAVHADGMEISILPFGCTSRDLTYPRFEGYYYAVIEPRNTVTEITVWQGDGVTAVDDGNMTADFSTVYSLANWPQIHESALVAKCLELTVGKQEAAA